MASRPPQRLPPAGWPQPRIIDGHRALLAAAGNHHQKTIRLHLHDESYWNLTGDPKKINLLAGGVEYGESRPLFWTLEPAKGRVFVSIPGHYAFTFDDPLFRVLLLRGIAWTAREPVDRFNSLVTPGARIKP